MPPPPHKRLKVTAPAAQSPVKQTLAKSKSKTTTLRLRLSSKGKGKAREDDEEEDEVKQVLFDDVLDEDQRDVSRTTINASDKDRFEKARVLAEVCMLGN